MKTASEIDQSLNRTLTILVSAIIHAALMVGICCSATEQKEKPVKVVTKLIEMKMVPKPQPPSPQPPKPQPPKPEPPKPEPPKPQPPKPEPPKPEPPKPQPPKPEPPKPQPPKPQPPKPVEVKPEPPKPEPTHVNKKPSRMDEIRAQLANSKVIKDNNNPRPRQTNTPPPAPPVKPVAGKSQDEYAERFKSGLSQQQEITLPPPGDTLDEISDMYAKRFVRAILYDNWHPSRGGMKYANPMPVYITFNVTPSGIATNPRITQQSNDTAMNDSVRDLISQLTSGRIRFTPFAQANIKQPYLTITVTMYLENK